MSKLVVLRAWVHLKCETKYSSVGPNSDEQCRSYICVVYLYVFPEKMMCYPIRVGFKILPFKKFTRSINNIRLVRSPAFQYPRWKKTSANSQQPHAATATATVGVVEKRECGVGQAVDQGRCQGAFNPRSGERVDHHGPPWTTNKIRRRGCMPRWRLASLSVCGTIHYSSKKNNSHKAGWWTDVD